MPGLLHEFVVEKIHQLLIEKMIANLVDSQLRLQPQSTILETIGIRIGGTSSIITPDGDKSPDQSYTHSSKTGLAYPNVVFEVARSQSFAQVAKKVSDLLISATGHIRFGWAIKIHQTSPKIEVIGFEYPHDPTDFEFSDHDSDDSSDSENTDSDGSSFDDYQQDQDDDEQNRIRIVFKAVIVNAVGHLQDAVNNRK